MYHNNVPGIRMKGLTVRGQSWDPARSKDFEVLLHIQGFSALQNIITFMSHQELYDTSGTYLSVDRDALLVNGDLVIKSASYYTSRKPVKNYNKMFKKPTQTLFAVGCLQTSGWARRCLDCSTR